MFWAAVDKAMPYVRGARGFAVGYGLWPWLAPILVHGRERSRPTARLDLLRFSPLVIGRERPRRYGLWGGQLGGRQAQASPMSSLPSTAGSGGTPTPIPDSIAAYSTMKIWGWTSTTPSPPTESDCSVRYT